MGTEDEIAKTFATNGEQETLCFEKPTAQHERKWWKEATVYQIYPSTFCDSNDDGIGDISGILRKLDHIKSIGTDVIWLSPHYRSPQIDMGYDISDFEDIHEPYGNLDDCQKLIDECHKHSMKIIFDLVINHTSSQHAWFKESRSSKDNPKRDWYFWRPPRYDSDGNRHPPNNWRSQFSVPAWTFDEKTEEYYLHIYAPEMPDLNWENASTRAAVYETSMHFWLRRGLDGFRIDTVNKYSKDITFPDAAITDPSSVTQPAMPHYSNGPRMYEFLSEMHEVFSQYRTFDGQEIMTVGELPNTPLESDVLSYVSASKKQLNMVFNFDVVSLGQKPGDRLVNIPFKHSDFISRMSIWQDFISKPLNRDAWTTVFLENHDQGRSISRFGNDSTEELRVRSGKMLAIILATMSGTLFLYQGQEIGMVNIPSEWDVEWYKDIRSQNFIKALREKGAGEDQLKEALKGMQRVARDNARLPMQWDDSFKNAGFTGEQIEPWMRVHPNHASVNVKSQEEDENSVLNFWKELLKFRKEYAGLFIYGDFYLRGVSRTAYYDPDGDIFSFKKIHRVDDCWQKQATVVANLSDKSVLWKAPKGHTYNRRSESTEWKLAFCNIANPECDINDQEEDRLQPYEARVYMSSP